MVEQLRSGRRGPGSLPGSSDGLHAAPGDMEPPPNLRDWLTALRGHLRLVAGTTAAAVAVAGYLAYASPPGYRATAVIRLVDARRALAGGLVGGEDQDGVLRPADAVLSQVEVLRSRATAGAVVDDMPILRIRAQHFPVTLVTNVHLAATVTEDSLRIHFGRQTLTARGLTEEREVAYGAPIELEGIGFTIAEPPARENGTLYVRGRDQVAGGLTRAMLVKPRENTDVIDISFTASDPQRAQEVANRVAQVFQAANAQAAQQGARRRREFIETQLRFNDSLLADARAGLSAFRAQAPGGASERTATPGGALAGRREELDIERRQYAGLLGQLRDTNRVARRGVLRNLIASSPSIGGNTVVSRLYDQLVRYETQRDSLITGDFARAPTNPDVQRLGPLIGATEADLVGAVRSVVASLDARIAVLDDLQARSISTARRLSTAQAADEVLAERVENTRRIADQLRVEYQKARIAEAVEVGEVEIVDLAPLPGAPVGVGAARTLTFGLLLGLLLGGGSAFLADHLNRSVHRREDVMHLGLPVLGVVPHARGGGASEDAAPIVEAMRGIRFNVLHAYGAKGPVLFTITSPGSREGKSFVASNLALAFADAGHRTLLIDGDLRRGSLYRILNTRRKPGLTDVLHGEVSSDQVIQTTRFPPLCFVGCGTRTPDAPELLGSTAMSKFIAGVGESFSAIVVDSPPLGAGVDAYALGAMTGNLVLVLRLGTTDREAAEAKLELLDRLPVRMLGTVLNDVPENSVYASYSYYMDGYAYEAERGREPRTLTGPPSRS